MSGGRLCGCGCGSPLEGSAKRRYLDGHRQRAYRRRLRDEAEARGLPPSMSLETLKATSAPRTRNGDGQRAADVREAPREPGDPPVPEGPGRLFAVIAEPEVRGFVRAPSRRAAIAQLPAGQTAVSPRALGVRPSHNDAPGRSK